MDIRALLASDAPAEEIQQQLEESLLDLDSEFRFKCRHCGKCCTHQETIIFNTRDIFNIARKLGKTMDEVINDYTEIDIGHDSRLPIVHLLSNGPHGTCPLLKDGRCSVHDCKPVVCALFPLGRVIINPKPDEAVETNVKPQIRYIINDYNCGSAKRVNTVRSWLARFGIPEQDDYFLLWNKIIMELGDMVRMMEERGFSDNTLQLVWNGIVEVLYIQYDTTKEFMPQFEAAAEKLLELCRETKKLAQLVDKGVDDGQAAST